MSDTRSAKKKQPSSKNRKKPRRQYPSFLDALDQLKDSLEFFCDLPLATERRIRNFQLDVERIQSSFHAKSPEYEWGDDDEEPLRDRIERAIAEADSVLSYCILGMIGEAELQQRIADRALDVYVANAEEYDAVLAETIPKGLRSKASPLIARRRYRDGSNATARDDWSVFLADFNDQVPGLPTGLPALNAALGGGLNGLTVVGAEEGKGKTSLCLMTMVATLRADPQLGCVLFTIDQSKSKTIAKLYSHVSGFSLDVLKRRPEERTADENLRIAEAEAELKTDLLPRIRFVERSNLSANKPLTIDTFSRPYLDLFSNSPDVCREMVIVDMIQSLTQLCRTVGTTNEVDESCLDVIQKFVAWSRNANNPEGCPVILVSEIRKTDRVVLTTNDLRGSARLGSVPDNILLLWPTPGTEQTGQRVSRTLQVAKSRQGDEGTILLDFHHKICRFLEVPADQKSKSKNISRSSSRSARQSRGSSL